MRGDEMLSGVVGAKIVGDVRVPQDHEMDNR